MFNLIAVLIALGLLMYLAFRGFSLLILAPITALLTGGLAAGVSLDAMHRVTAVASGALDALPHNGAVITLLTVCGISHRQGYGEVFIVVSVIPMLALIIIIVLASLVGSF